MAREINAQVYDTNIRIEGIQVQIDNYYQPKYIPQQRRINNVLELLVPTENEMILDIGCGVGTFAYHAAKMGARTFGIDYSFESIKMAKKLGQQFTTSAKSFFVTGSAFQLPYQDGSFDKIVAVDFIEHITHAEKHTLLKEIHRVLKPNGTGVIFTPNAIREKIGDLYWKIRHVFLKNKMPVTDLHYGLISRFRFESMLRNYKFDFHSFYRDTTRPLLAKMPFLKHFLALNLLWVIHKK